MNIKFRCEADQYGYAGWLAKHLGFTFNPLSLRGFQHGWIWWNSSDYPYKPGIGLDPNLNDFFGVLVQDKEVENFLTQKGVYAKACGLPFLNFYQHFLLRGTFTASRKDKILFIPTHSNPTSNFSNSIYQSIHLFKEIYGEVSVLLGATDYEIFKPLEEEKIHFLKGAGVTDADSFYRLAKHFESHEYIITDTIGSHICYALHCGAKVGINKQLYDIAMKNELSIDNPDNRNLFQQDDYEKYLKIRSLDYLESRFPSLTIDDNLPSYNTPPTIAYEKPHIIATELGWDITYPCEQHKL